MTNRLADETSPYLLQHQDNPVEWYPWGPEALTRARAEDKPILLSIGYAACHWCHVMAHESFEDDTTAQFMNEHFINVKVDREERPDLDQIYMSAVQAMTGQGGWPMTVVLTPDGTPFFGGTYFPRTPRYGMPSFLQVLESVRRAWQDKRADIVKNAAEVVGHINRVVALDGPGGVLTEELLAQAVQGLQRQYDRHRGGFGRAPKFPQPMTLEFLLQAGLRLDESEAWSMAEHTLTMMAQGGIYDHLGGGFARYATDDEWLVPHFEKMLYDNAQLARVYLHAFAATGKPLFRRVAEETLDYVLREMQHEEGGFYSSQDADSEGEEGKFYVWQPEEVRAVLGEDADLFMLYYDVTARGNWEGKSILHVERSLTEVAALARLPEPEVSQRLERARTRLLAARSNRVWPGLDDKVLTAWNGLMLAALAEAAWLLDRPDYRNAAMRNATFLYETMRRPDGRLFRTWKAGGEARLNAYLEDYSYLADGLLALYELTFAPRWFIWAQELAELMVAHFSDEQRGGFFDTSDDHEDLILRPKEVQDNAVPSGNAMAARVLARLSLLTGRSDYWDRAAGATRAMAPAMTQYPSAFAHWLTVATLLTARPLEVAIAGEPAASDTAALLAVSRQGYRPFQVLAVGLAPGPIPLLQDRPQHDGQATAYVCRGFVCDRPVTTPEELSALLSG